MQPVVWFIVLGSCVACGGLTLGGGRDPGESDDEPTSALEQDPPMLVASEVYSRETDSATASCYQTGQLEVPATQQAFLGCWVRGTEADEYTLSFLPDGSFVRTHDGGDVAGSDRGWWEAAAGGLVLHPPDGACSLNGNEACQRVATNDSEVNTITLRRELSSSGPDPYEFLLESWQKADTCPCIEDPEFCGGDLSDPLSESTCQLDAFTPLELSLIEVELQQAPGPVLEGTLHFQAESAPRELPEFDMQRQLAPSVLAFTLSTPDGAQLRAFERHVTQGDRRPGDFLIRYRSESGPRIHFVVEDYPPGPAPLLLRYDIASAKYFSDTGSQSMDVRILEGDQ